MKYLILSLSLVISSHIAQAKGFSAVEDACAVTSTETVKFEIPPDNFESEIKVEFLFSGAQVPMPRIRITFLQHEAKSASVKWTSIKTVSKGLPWFSDAIVEQVLLEEDKAFATKIVSAPGTIPLVFETEPLDIGRSQNLVALFLSQTKMIVTASPNNVDYWNAELSLTNSDSSYRKMASRCYAEAVQGYIKNGEAASVKPVEGQKKMSTLAPHYSTGYGLVDFSWIKNYLPTDLQALALVGAGEDELTANQKISDLLTYARQKRDSQALLDQQNRDPNYVELNNQLTAYYQDLQTSYARFMVVTGNSPTATESLIAQKLAEQETLKQTIAALTTQIEEATRAQADLINQVAGTETQLAPLNQQMAVFEATLAERALRLQQITTQQSHLIALFEEHQAHLVAWGTTAEPLTQPPWSVEEIEKNSEANNQRAAQIELISSLKTQLQGLLPELQSLLEKANSSNELYKAYNSLRAEKAKAERELAAEERWLYSHRQVPYFTVATPEYFSGLNSKIEEDLIAAGIIRDYKGETTYNGELFEKVKAEFVQLKTITKDLIPSMFCSPDVLTNASAKKTPCLTVDETLDDKVVENYLLNLPPVNLDALIVMVYGQVDQPWTRQESKTQILLDRYHEEINKPTANLQSLVDAWGRLRAVSWRVLTSESEGAALDVCAEPKPVELFAEQKYSTAFYNKFFECQKIEVQNHETVRAEKIAKIGQVSSQLDGAYQAFQASNGEFYNSSQAFVTRAAEQITSVKDAAEFSQSFIACSLPMAAPENCLSTIQTVITGAETRIASEQQVYVDLARALVANINAQLTLIAQEVQQIQNETTHINTEKTNFSAANNIEGLSTQKTNLQTQLTAVEKQISDLSAQKAVQNNGLNAAVQSESLFRGEAQQLVTHIEATTAQIKALLPSYMPYCSAIVPTSEKLQQLDASLYQLYGVNMSGDAKIYSSCQMPSLENYIPNREGLGPLPLTPQR